MKVRSTGSSPPSTRVAAIAFRVVADRGDAEDVARELAEHRLAESLREARERACDPLAFRATYGPTLVREYATALIPGRLASLMVRLERHGTRTGR